jgi:phosphoribosylaminoimidazole-succinocarboxamide synthase
MGLENLALANTHDLPIKRVGNVHNGKVRSVYWLDEDDSSRLVAQNDYPVASGTQLGVMVISDRISAFDCNWKGEEGLNGIPGKGAALNSISEYWFDRFNSDSIAGNHILDVPHPLVWIVQRARPIMVEAVVRQYITGSMWRDYAKGVRDFCGNQLPEGLKEHQRLKELLFTPTTKGVMKGLEGIPEADDVNITEKDMEKHYQAFGFLQMAHINDFKSLVFSGFKMIESDLDMLHQIFVDTKFELGYVKDMDGYWNMIYIDEVGTPDSSRLWDTAAYKQGKIVENSKEGFRQFLLANLERDILLNKARFEERKALAASYRVPVSQMMEVSQTYKNIAEKITGMDIPQIENARGEILDRLSEARYQIVK